MLIENRPAIHALLHLVGLRSATTQTSDSERQLLARFADSRRRLAEIGVFQGVTTRLLSSVMAESGTYFAIDPYPGNRFGIDFCETIARREVRRGAVGKVIWIRKTGSEAASDPLVTAEPFDFLFIDGDHSYDGLKGDWEGWRPLIDSGGLVAFHDTVGTSFGCRHYLEKHILTDPEFSRVATQDTTMVIQRKSR